MLSRGVCSSAATVRGEANECSPNERKYPFSMARFACSGEPIKPWKITAFSVRFERCFITCSKVRTQWIITGLPNFSARVSCSSKSSICRSKSTLHTESNPISPMASAPTTRFSISVMLRSAASHGCFGYKFTIILIFNAKKEFDNAIFRGINCIFARDFKEIF